MPNALIIECPTCGANNRIPTDKLSNGVVPVCGNCKKPLPLTARPVVVTDATFSAEVERSPIPVLLDLWAPWCGPCQMIAPALDQLATELTGRVRIAKLNVDENPVTSDRFQVRSIPCLLILQNGREVDRIVGAQPKTEIAKRLSRAVPTAFQGQ